MSIEKHWADFIWRLYREPAEGEVLQSKMHSWVDLIIPAKDWTVGVSSTWNQMGYVGRSTKMQQLQRNYLNLDSIQAANAKFRERGAGSSRQASQSCVTAIMGAKEKSKKSQGFCMLTATINHCHDSLYIDFNYRSTEVTQKFLADLKFLHDVVVPMLLEGCQRELTAVRFHFSIAYVSALFLPVYYQHVDMVEFLKMLEASDPEFLRTSVIKEVRKQMQPTHCYTYRTRIKMHDFFREHIFPTLTKSDIRYITQLIRRYS